MLAIWLILAHVIKGQKLLEQLTFSRVHQEKLNREKAINCVCYHDLYLAKFNLSHNHFIYENAHCLFILLSSL